MGGPKSVTDFARSIGDGITRLDRKEPELNTVAASPDWDTTSPAAMAADLQRLLTTNVLSPASRQQLEAWLEQNQTGAGMIRASVPPGWKVGDKTGRSGDGAINDVAILRPPRAGPIFIAIYTVVPRLSPEQRVHTVVEVAKPAIAELSK